MARSDTATSYLAARKRLGPLRSTGLFALVARAAADGLWGWDAATGGMFYSERFRELLGYAEAGFPNTLDAFRGVLHHADRPRLDEALRDHLERRLPFDVEFRLRVADGTCRWFWGRGQAVWDDAGRPLRMAGSLSDVTDRRRAEAALRDSEARYRALLRHYPDGAVFLADHDLRLLVADGQALHAAGMDPAAIAGRRLHEVLAPESAIALEPEYRAALAGEERSFTSQHAGRVYDGRAVPVRDDAGRVVAAMVLARDVTERARADAEREALEAQLRQAQKMGAVGQLAGGVAHAFNNLLTVILGNLEFARGDLPADLPGDHPVRADLDEVRAAAERARTLVRQLLAFSRKRGVRPRRVDAGDLVRGAAALLRRVIGEEIALAVEVGEGLPPVRVDPGQLEQVLMNLAVNARDAMLTARHGHHGAGGTLLIEVTARTLAADEAAAWDGVAPGPVVQLVVRDSGHGMDAHARARAFEPFFTTKEVGRGTGLGLATVFGIVTQAGGAIRLDSAPGAGTTLTILLPADPLDADDDFQTFAPAAPAEGSGATVLLVEDEAAVRVTARRILERRRYTVLEARHGADALLLWREHGARVDVVVTDLRMPELGGRELVELLRAEAPSLPVVYLSGYTDQRPAESPAGCDTFVDKPFSVEALLASVERALRGRAPAGAAGAGG